jgi:ribosome biogenesis GTPase
VRRKDWLSDNLDDPDVYYDRDIAADERIVPKGETERRRTNTPGPVVAGGSGSAAATGMTTAPRDAIAAPATVIEVSTGLCRVQIDGRPILCEIRPSVRSSHSGYSNVVAVGDHVLVRMNGSERGYVEAVLPRRSALARPDVFYPHLQQVIVANVDQLLIVAAWREPAYWPELVDRYLISAQRNNLTAIICVNKVDLAEDPDEPRRLLAPYGDMGVPVLFTSAETTEGVEALRRLLTGRTTALAGLSGVGKSSLLSAAEPGLNLKVGEVSDRKHEGRHTTTQASLHPLHAGGFVVDTPGIREFGLSGLAPAELLRFYPDLGWVGQGCRFEDCAHLEESGCAVRVAARNGAVSAMRYDNYLKIRRSLTE